MNFQPEVHSCLSLQPEMMNRVLVNLVYVNDHELCFVCFLYYDEIHFFCCLSQVIWGQNFFAVNKGIYEELECDKLCEGRHIRRNVLRI